jgi:hypothetical protein
MTNAEKTFCYWTVNRVPKNNKWHKLTVLIKRDKKDIEISGLVISENPIKSNEEMAYYNLGKCEFGIKYTEVLNGKTKSKKTRV